jgi:hypothetical protein
MSEAVILALIVLAGQVVVGIFNWLSNRALAAKVEIIHKQTNSMHSELVKGEYKRGGEGGAPAGGQGRSPSRGDRR